MFSLSTIFTQDFNRLIEGNNYTDTLHYGLSMFIPIAVGMVCSTFFYKFIKHIDIKKIMIIFIIGEAAAYGSMTFVSYAHS
jgi:glucose uptake protein GlcU